MLRHEPDALDAICRMLEPLPYLFALYLEAHVLYWWFSR